MASPLRQYAKARLQHVQRILGHVEKMECLDTQQQAHVHIAIDSVQKTIRSLNAELPTQLSSDLPPTDGLDHT